MTEETGALTAARLRGLVREGSLGDWAVLASLGLIGLAVLHVWVFSSYDLPTTLAVLGVADRTQVVIATAASVIPTFGAGWLLVRLVEIRRHIRKVRAGGPREMAVWFTVISFGIPAIVAILSPAAIVVFGSAAVVIWILRARARRRGSLDPSDNKIWVTPEHHRAAQSGLAAAVVIVIAVNFALPWTPREEVQATGVGRKVGYIVGTSEGRLLMRVQDHGVVWIPAADVTERRLCATAHDSFWLTPITYRFALHPYKDCKD